MIGMLEFATEDGSSVWAIVWEFSREMAVGLVAGAVGAALLLPVMRRISLPNPGLYPIRVLAAAGVIYGGASLLDGSGFVAVFVAGILTGDARAPYKGEIERFHKALASLAEVVVFIALGVTFDLTDLFESGDWLEGIVLALVLVLVARPLVVGLLLLPVRLRHGERLFVMWGGLKGAVPILLAAFVVLAAVDDATRVYHIVFVVVAFSVLVQGTTIPYVAARCGIPMRRIEPEPWDVSIRLRREPSGLRRFVVGPGARASGRPIRDLPLGEGTWVTLVVADGEARQARGSYVLEEGDELLVLSDEADAAGLRRLFEG
jgi:cell volume regulation protein A